MYLFRLDQNSVLSSVLIWFHIIREQEINVMKYLTLMKLLMITSFMLNPVHANEIEHPFYFNGGFRLTFGPDYDLNRLYVGLGFQQQYWAVEAELGSGVGDDTVRKNGVTVDVDSEFGYGIYALARYPFGGIGSDFFLRLGYEDLGVDTRGGSLGSNESLAGAAYGFGFHVFKFRWGGLRLEYTGTEGDADSLSGAYVLVF